MNLPPHTIDIWHISLSKTKSLPMHVLSAHEQSRYHRFQFEKHKQYFAQSTIALRTILAYYLGCTPETIAFEYEAHGKPILQSGQLHFNLTHSKNIALLAVSEQHPLGIDIELFSERPYHELATRVFSEKEQRDLHQLPPALLPLGFFSLWSQKESLIKACGIGLSYPLETLTFQPFPQQETMMHEPIHNQMWKVLPFMPYPASCAAVCYHPDIHNIRHFTYEP